MNLVYLLDILDTFINSSKKWNIKIKNKNKRRRNKKKTDVELFRRPNLEIDRSSYDLELKYQKVDDWWENIKTMQQLKYLMKTVKLDEKILNNKLNNNFHAYFMP